MKVITVIDLNLGSIATQNFGKLAREHYHILTEEQLEEISAALEEQYNGKTPKDCTTIKEVEDIFTSPYKIPQTFGFKNWDILEGYNKKE